MTTCLNQLFFLSVFLFLCGCASGETLSPLNSSTSIACTKTFSLASSSSTETQLDLVSDLFNQKCWRETIQLATFIRNQRRDKFYHLAQEIPELLTPEGTFTEYVLESYERSFLTVLIAASYLYLHQPDDALVELRRCQREENALIYNSGQDPVITVLLAAMWDRFDPQIARPYWLNVSRNSLLDSDILAFSKARVEKIDSGSSRTTEWRIWGIGTLPELDWRSHFLGDTEENHSTTNSHGVATSIEPQSSSATTYTILPKTPFPQNCARKQSLFISTASWVNKIEAKYNADYHPWLLAKSVARLPFGIGYGAVGSVAGIAVGLGGCGIATKGGQGGGDLCKASLELAALMISSSADVVEYTLSPDIRHWKKLPIGFYISNSADASDSQECLRSLNLVGNETLALTP